MEDEYDEDQELHHLEQLRMQKLGMHIDRSPGGALRSSVEERSSWRDGGEERGSWRDVELERLEQLNEQLEAKKAEVLRRADELVVSARDKLTPQQSRYARGAALTPPSDYVRTSREATRPSSSPDTNKKPDAKNFKSPVDMSQPSLREEQKTLSRSIDMDLEEEEDEVAARQLGPEATIRFLLAKLKVLKSELRQANTALRDKATKKLDLEQRLQTLQQDNAKLNKANGALQQQSDRLHKAHTEATEKAALLEQQLLQARRDTDNIQRQSKHHDQDRSARELRLNRALEEVDRLKAALSEAQAEGRDTSDNTRRKLDKLTQEARRRDRVEQELLGVIRKQLKLIDVLKRQKVHIEAAHLLKFTEDEFAATLELGEKL